LKLESDAVHACVPGALVDQELENAPLIRYDGHFLSVIVDERSDSLRQRTGIVERLQAHLQRQPRRVMQGNQDRCGRLRPAEGRVIAGFAPVPSIGEQHRVRFSADVDAAVGTGLVAEKAIRLDEIVAADRQIVAGGEDQACRVGERVADPAVERDDLVCAEIAE